jgi:AAA ATPase domain
MEGALIGRKAELEALRSFLERADESAAALVLEGEPGIGKTALWRVGVEAAAGRGFRVLTSRPTGSEARLSFAGSAISSPQPPRMSCPSCRRHSGTRSRSRSPSPSRGHRSTGASWASLSAASSSCSPGGSSC